MSEVDTAEVTVGEVVAGASKSGYKALGLKECGKFDMEKGAREKLTGWGAICAERFENRKSKRGVARRERKG